MSDNSAKVLPEAPKPEAINIGTGVFIKNAIMGLSRSLAGTITVHLFNGDAVDTHASAQSSMVGAENPLDKIAKGLWDYRG